MIHTHIYPDKKSRSSIKNVSWYFQLVSSGFKPWAWAFGGGDTPPNFKSLILVSDYFTWIILIQFTVCRKMISSRLVLHIVYFVSKDSVTEIQELVRLLICYDMGHYMG